VAVLGLGFEGSGYRVQGSGVEESYLRLIDSCITQLKAQGPTAPSSATRRSRCTPRARVAARGASLRRNVKRFRGGLVFKAHRLVYHSTLGLRVIKKKRLASAVATFQLQAASGQRGNTLKGLKDLYLKANAKTWPGLSRLCHICSTAVRFSCRHVSAVSGNLRFRFIKLESLTRKFFGLSLTRPSWAARRHSSELLLLYYSQT